MEQGFRKVADKIDVQLETPLNCYSGLESNSLKQSFATIWIQWKVCVILQDLVWQQGREFPPLTVCGTRGGGGRSKPEFSLSALN